MRTIIFTALFIVSGVFAPGVSAQQEIETATKTIAAGVVNGKALNLSKPEYPPAAETAKASGEVKVQVVIDEKGDVISAKAVSGHPLLREASEKAALQSKFSPTYLSGKTVKVTGTIVYNFVPRQEKLISEQDKEFAWVLGLMLSFLESADSNLIDAIGSEAELKEALAEAALDLPTEILAEKSLFEKLAKAEGEQRRVAAAELNRALKKYFTGAELWQYQVGENLGVITTEMIRHAKNAMDGNPKLDEAILKTRLSLVKEQMLSVPAGVSPAMTGTFKRIAAFADKKDLTSIESLHQLFEAIDPLFHSLDEK